MSHNSVSSVAFFFNIRRKEAQYPLVVFAILFDFSGKQLKIKNTQTLFD